eukprot:TRINITY_DN4734_c0_g1_i2.p1 TRINITY_DN4734_c0_g1~~TRINITY_DN4734_c0_g1_i2.p1  ORF type:complete len:529 (+),score=70.89 TRINITY_DN4734_c0_g1_i2:350-1936(+)
MEFLKNENSGRKQNGPEDMIIIDDTPSPTNGDDMITCGSSLNDLVPCGMCKKRCDITQSMFLDECGHCFCIKCCHDEIMKLVNQQRCSSIRCFDRSCTKNLSPQDIKFVLSPGEYETFLSTSLNETLKSNENFVKCPNTKCYNFIETVFSVNSAHTSKIDKRDAASYKERFRFRCRECSTEFCAACKLVPYHEGFTCESYLEDKKAKHCRFCGDKIETIMIDVDASQPTTTSSDICHKPDCAERSRTICTKRHKPCNHYCSGVRDEEECLPCLHPDCRPEDKFSQNGDSYCNICWVEGLSSAPSVMLKCGHIFHRHCILKKVENSWSSSNITFSFAECPLCNQWIEHVSLKTVMEPINSLHEDIKSKALQRLKFLNLESVDELKNPSSRFYQKPDVYAMKRFCYYPCFKCKKPYFGGERACNAEQRVGENFDPSELICGGCSDTGKQNCDKHGTDYIEWKCKFCCNLACWFCWGNTHFCDECHKQASKVAKTPKEQLPKCNCDKKHPQNGDEHCFGCSLCRIDSNNNF